MAQGITPWIEIARTGTFHDSRGRPHTFSRRKKAPGTAVAGSADPRKPVA
ncbi:MAG: hypothetical protein LBB60_02660 [Desulfovibrio sp.]|nr:hypothetical protein [Desulfovibrio sp.]